MTPTRYVAFYQGQRHEFEALGAYAAGIAACTHFNTTKRFQVAILLHSQEAKYLADKAAIIAHRALLAEIAY